MEDGRGAGWSALSGSARPARTRRGASRTSRLRLRSDQRSRHMTTQASSLSEAEKPLEIDRGGAGEPKLIVTDRAGVERTIQAAEGLSVMAIIRNGGADEPFALCEGNCSCATCHVYVDAAFAEAIPKIGADESGLLDGSD